MSRVGDFVHTIRFRLTALYSTALLVVGAVALLCVYIALSRSADAQPITKTFEVDKVVYDDGQRKVLGTINAAEVDAVESAVNYETQNTLRNYSFVALGGLFAVSLLIGWVLSGRALRPVRTMARTAEDIQVHDLSRRIRLGGPRDELGRLSDTIDSMLDRLDDAFRSQRQLIADASHELRSPLAIIRTNVDAVLSSPDSTESERQQATAVIERATSRMSRLVDDLLASARRAAPAFVDADLDLSEVAREAGEDCAALAQAEGVHIHHHWTEAVTVIGDRDALRRAIANLLSNAIRYAPTESAVDVHTGTEAGWRWVAVRDEGPGISAADQPKIFDRFWTAQSGGAGQRTGLGLAIVRQIVESHDGVVRIHSRPGAGSTFVIWLPRPADGDGDDSPADPPDSNPLG